LKGKRLDGSVKNVPEGAGWPGRICMAKSTGSKGTGDDAAEVFEGRQERFTCWILPLKDKHRPKNGGGEEKVLR